MTDEWLWLSTERMTVMVRIAHDRVVQGPPIVRKFLGQPKQNLLGWLSRQPGYLIYTCSIKEET